MVSFDRTEKQITVRHQNQKSVIDYDMLVIATGARRTSFHHSVRVQSKNVYTN